MKVIQIPRVYVNEKSQMEMVYKKIFLTEKEGEKYLRFPVDLFDEETEEELHGEIYEVAGKTVEHVIGSVLKQANEQQENTSFESVCENVAAFLSIQNKNEYHLIVTCLELGEEGEDIIVIDYYKDLLIFDPDSFGIDLLKEVAKEKLESFVEMIIKKEI